MILTKEVYVGLSPANIKHYGELGYEIPKEKDKWNRFRTLRKTKIKVDIKDLKKGSNVEVDIQCDECKEILNISYNDYNRYVHEDGKYYCNKCAKKIFMSGINHPNYGNVWSKKGKDSPHWNLNLSDDEREKQRNTKENTEWIRMVLNRDNYICQCCNIKDKTGKGLNAHHLDGYDLFIEKRADVTNGVTLCKTCHRNFHSICGYGNNTKVQYEEWIGHAVDILQYEGVLLTTRKVYCLEEGKIYNGVVELSKEWNYSNSRIYDCCNHKVKRRKERRELKDGSVKITIREYEVKTIKGKHLLWVDEAIKLKYILEE